MAKSSLQATSTMKRHSALKTKTGLKAKAQEPKKKSLSIGLLPKVNPRAKSAAAGDGLLFAKGQRVASQKVIDAAKKPFCEVCGKPSCGEPHHIVTRGAGGPDHPYNLIQLCWDCHYVKVPAGEYSKEFLWGIVSRREEKPVSEIEQEVMRLRAS